MQVIQRHYHYKQIRLSKRLYMFLYFSDDAIIIVTISQIALSVALILGIIALLLLWYRMLITNYAS